MREVCCLAYGGVSADGKPARGRTIITTDSVRKKNRSKALDRWMELKKALRNQTHTVQSVNISAIDACISEIGTCIIKDAGRQSAHTKNN